MSVKRGIETVSRLAAEEHEARRAKSIGGYRGALKSAVRGLWSQQTLRYEFVAQVRVAVELFYREAFLAGMKACGLAPEEGTLEEQQTLFDLIATDHASVSGWADFVEAHNQGSGGKLSALDYRTETWVNRYNAVNSVAQRMACGDRKLKWVYGPTEHCDDCRKLNGRVYRASTWAAYDLQPQNRNLQCGGWRCQCKFHPTNEPLTPGRPPDLVG
jgi:hypothetical protein